MKMESKKVLRPNPSPATVTRHLIIPVRAVLNHAADRGWCDPPRMKTPKQPEGRVVFLFPSEAKRLVLASSPHLKPLITYLLCTGSRMSEALYLDWRDVDLDGARVIYWPDQTKGEKRRIAHLPPSAVAALTALPHRDGRVFQWRDRRGVVRDYAEAEREYGGQIKTAWKGALRRSGIMTAITPHGLRHTWATWHYATNRDLLALKVEGGWSSVSLVERYAHVMPKGYEDQIQAFWEGRADAGVGLLLA